MPGAIPCIIPSRWTAPWTTLRQSQSPRKTDKRHSPLSGKRKGSTLRCKSRRPEHAPPMVVYKQHVRNCKGKYILLTTHAWGEPLHDSHYSVTISSSLTLTYLSYVCDSIKSGNHGLTYYFYRDNFLPDRDIDVSWKKNDPD